jgi:hypothetical protein
MEVRIEKLRSVINSFDNIVCDRHASQLLIEKRRQRKAYLATALAPAALVGIHLLLVLLPHGILDRLKAFVRSGVFACPAIAYSLAQLVEREFGIWILLWHNQETSDLASSKHRPIFILTLS